MSAASAAAAAAVADDLPEDLQTLRSLLEKAQEVYFGTLEDLEVEGEVARCRPG